MANCGIHLKLLCFFRFSSHITCWLLESQEINAKWKAFISKHFRHHRRESGHSSGRSQPSNKAFHQSRDAGQTASGRVRLHTEDEGSHRWWVHAHFNKLSFQFYSKRPLAISNHAKRNITIFPHFLQEFLHIKRCEVLHATSAKESNIFEAKVPKFIEIWRNEYQAFQAPPLLPSSPLFAALVAPLYPTRSRPCASREGNALAPKGISVSRHSLEIGMRKNGAATGLVIILARRER